MRMNKQLYSTAFSILWSDFTKPPSPIPRTIIQWSAIHIIVTITDKNREKTQEAGTWASAGPLCNPIYLIPLLSPDGGGDGGGGGFSKPKPPPVAPPGIGKLTRGPGSPGIPTSKMMGKSTKSSTSSSSSSSCSSSAIPVCTGLVQIFTQPDAATAATQTSTACTTITTCSIGTTTLQTSVVSACIRITRAPFPISAVPLKTSTLPAMTTMPPHGPNISKSSNIWMYRHPSPFSNPHTHLAKPPSSSYHTLKANSHRNTTIKPEESRPVTGTSTSCNCGALMIDTNTTTISGGWYLGCVTREPWVTVSTSVLPPPPSAPPPPPNPCKPSHDNYFGGFTGFIVQVRGPILTTCICENQEFGCRSWFAFVGRQSVHMTLQQNRFLIIGSGR
ncbi:hypothetical protein K469DRAFT_689020 [Zopfia rhizophila CBS 207.26]|uniref:Uncharacterized protein n=1 Tax=Zopfia rhizophila CBS 207.26 TaxID=1314779 RepID=A0A6A6EP22_9PEZI|nr:hypothetical protein K469DRAFT_689020 [Zopfia rhizophila CBS 207.26]